MVIQCEVNRCSRCAMSRGYPSPPELTSPLPHEVEDVTAELRRYGVPLVAFGQTLFWDEPAKAALRRLLDDYAPEITLFAGIHDSDYFSKLHGRGRSGEGFVLWSNNDWTHRALWAAVGETTSLFGAETPPSIAELQAAGVPLRMLAANSSIERDAFLDTATLAYGWRGVAQLGPREQIAYDVPVSQAGESLVALFEWGLSETISLLVEPDIRKAAEQRAEFLVARLRSAIAEMPEATLSQLYQRLITEHYADLLGYSSAKVQATSTVEYLRFNRQTCAQARFQPLQAFLCHRVGFCARETYNDAVVGQGMYGLDQFGEGAIPFDLIVPGRGRGTLRILDHEIRAEFESGPLSIPTEERVYLLEDLAALIEEAVGPNAAVAGKALLGPVMFCSEAVLVLHEGASAYVPRTRLWLSRLNRTCASLRTYPILRLTHHAYDALAKVKVTFRLPAHLAEAFGSERVTAANFAGRWKSVLAEQEHLLDRLAKATSVSALVEVIAEERGHEWRSVWEELQEARQTLRHVGLAIRKRLDRLSEIRYHERRARRRRAEFERRSGDLRRKEDATGDFTPRQALRQLIGAISDEIEQYRSQRAKLRVEIAELTNTPDVHAAREKIRAITLQAEQQRLELARRALLVRHMEIGDRRPTSWWFTIVDPAGDWFEEAVRRAEIRLQPLHLSSTEDHEMP
ncbi:MAG: hypothetical protein ACUVX8_07075 [Candidatus Zipacnadales bacterium]